MLKGGRLGFGISVLCLLPPILHFVTGPLGPFIGGFVGGSQAEADLGKSVGIGVIMGSLLAIPLAIVAEVLPRAAISAVNLSEVVAKLAEAGMPEEAIRDALQGLPLEVVPFDLEQAYGAGLLRPTTKDVGLSLGDRGCLSLACRLAVPALTADRTWEQLSVGATVKAIR